MTGPACNWEVLPRDSSFHTAIYPLFPTSLNLHPLAIVQGHTAPSYISPQLPWLRSFTSFHCLLFWSVRISPSGRGATRTFLMRRGDRGLSFASMGRHKKDQIARDNTKRCTIPILKQNAAQIQIQIYSEQSTVACLPFPGTLPRSLDKALDFSYFPLSRESDFSYSSATALYLSQEVKEEKEQ